MTSGAHPPHGSGPVADLSEQLTGGRHVFLAAATRGGVDLAEAGWVEHELAACGTATSYQAETLPADGRFELQPRGTAPYRTRAIVRCPADRAAFSGTVVVEWLNVSGGLDANPDWVYLAEELVRQGTAWVGVSAQFFGVEGGAVAVDAGAGEGVAGLGLKHVDEARYGSLAHPGDAFAYDIFSHVGRAVRAAEVPALAGLEVEQVLAVGESQSAFALVTYIDGVHPLAGVYDGFLVHSRGRAALPLGEPGTGATAVESIAGPPARLRTDLDVPVLVVQTETDLTAVLGSYDARQDDTERLRLWEVAGTAHADATILGGLAHMVDCGVPINDGPQRFVLRAALRHLVRWAGGGEPPPVAARLVADPGPDGAVIRRDADGIALGGIRLPQVEVPVATLSGEPGRTDSLMCRLLGSTVAFTPERLAERYASRAAYLAEYRAAADRAIAEGFALEDDRHEIVADARPEVVPG